MDELASKNNEGFNDCMTSGLRATLRGVVQTPYPISSLTEGRHRPECAIADGRMQNTLLFFPGVEDEPGRNSGQRRESSNRYPGIMRHVDGE